MYFFPFRRMSPRVFPSLTFPPHTLSYRFLRVVSPLRSFVVSCTSGSVQSFFFLPTEPFSSFFESVFYLFILAFSFVRDFLSGIREILSGKIQTPFFFRLHTPPGLLRTSWSTHLGIPHFFPCLCVIYRPARTLSA